MKTGMKLLFGLFAVLSLSALSGPVSAKGTYECQDKGSRNFGICKTLAHGMCSITVGDGTTVKLPCKDLRRFKR